MAPGTHIVWLDQVLPMYRKDAFAIEAVIGMVKSTNHRFRVVTIFRRLGAATAAERAGRAGVPARAGRGRGAAFSAGGARAGDDSDVDREGDTGREGEPVPSGWPAVSLVVWFVASHLGASCPTTTHRSNDATAVDAAVN